MRNMPFTEGTIMGRYADDTAVMTKSQKSEITTHNLNAAADELDAWSTQ